MYQNCCKKCGSLELHTEVKGSNTGLYCSDCGAWIKWLCKDELRAFEHAKIKENEIIHANLVDCALDNIGLNSIKKELSEFIDFLDEQIDKEICRTPLSITDSAVKSATALAYERDRKALINILNGRHWNENPT
ncbi:hypothetical protein KQI61_06115 [Anaerocolumna aminovalerica]|uniref:hypothetical protein n=1 Tax=Anaerocolumna aminovalerica TaxID=1527 RepID=UPI001C0F1130|nr:hypothetical protein [Anaerocolumna aminovalerica]MBU5331766.1 hypothetical protein [Anaerocolumna aminovalerica]